MFVKIAKQSLFNRKGTVVLTIIALTISIFVLLAVEHIRVQAKQSFNRTVSGVDLIVGPRTGSLNLLLGSVFRIGETGQAISAEVYQKLAKHPMVDWVAPIALGDSHKGHRVIATTHSYFQNYKYGNKQALEFKVGTLPQDDFDLVLGADVANKFSYENGDEIILSHGTGITSFTHHEATPFRVVGILEKTGTPVDQALHIGFKGLELMHKKSGHSSQSPTLNSKPIGKNATIAKPIDEHQHQSGHEHEHEHQNERAHALEQNSHERIDSHERFDSHERGHSHESSEDPEHLNGAKVSAVFVGLKARYASLIMQKWANDYKAEPISAILPGVALTQLWRIVGSVEVVLQVIAGLVLLTTLIGMSTMLLATMKERTREIAIMRTLGARPIFVFGLIQLEVLLITLISLILATLGLYVALVASQAMLATELGLFIDVVIINSNTFKIWAAVLVGSILVGLLPALKAYRSSLQASLQVKV